MGAPPQLDVTSTLRHDPTWRGLPLAAQWLYGVIASDPWCDTAGAMRVLPRRWATTAAGTTTSEIERALCALVDVGRAFVAAGEYEEFVLLPRLLVDTGRSRNPNLLRRAVKTARGWEVSALRERFAEVLAELDPDDAGLALAAGRRRRPFPPALRMAVYLRDEWTCQDCGRVILPMTAEERRGLRAPYDGQGWLELDHEHPWSEGGEDTEENLRALCSRCNRLKGARMLVGAGEVVTP